MIALVTIAHPVSAQEGVTQCASLSDYDPWQADYDFTVADYGWVEYFGGTNPPYGEWIDGTGFESEAEDNGTYITQRLYGSIAIQTPGIAVYRVELDWELAGGSSQLFWDNGWAFRRVNSEFNTARSYYVGTQGTTNSAATYIDSSGGDVLPPAVHNRIHFAFANQTSAITITGLTVYGCSPPETYTRPFAAGDLYSEWGYFNPALDETNPVLSDTVAGFSSDVGAGVYPAAAGTVQSITALSETDCIVFFALSSSGCKVIVSGAGAGESYRIPIEGLSKVVISANGSSRQFEYVVQNAARHIAEGIAVNTSCTIGESFASEGGGLFGAATNAIGLVGVIVTEDSSEIDALNNFTIDPTGGQPCASEPGYENCLAGTSVFSDEWASSRAQFNDIAGDGNRVRIQADGYIQRDFNLNADVDVVVKGMGLGGNARAEVTIAGATTELNFPTQHENRVATATISQSDIYSIRIDNPGLVILELTSVCVQFSTGNNPTAPPGTPGNDPEQDAEQSACIVSNPSFSDGINHWTLSANGDYRIGEVLLSTSESITQHVTVPAGDYYVSARVSLWHYSQYQHDPNNTTGSVNLEWDFPAGSGYTVLSSKTYADFADGTNLLTFQDAITFTETTGDFNLRAVLTSIPSGVRGVTIRDVCLSAGSPGSGDPPPWGGDGEAGGDAPFDATCKVISTPSGDSIGLWLQWHWAKFNNFFQCELMILLNALYSTVTDFYTMAGWSIRWSQTVTSRSLDWFAYEVLPYLAGYLSNIAYASAPNTVEVNQQCGNIFCLLAGLIDGLETLITQIVDRVVTPIMDFLFWLIRLVLDLIGHVIRGLIQVFITLLTEFIRLFGLVRNLFALLLEAYITAPPEPIPGLPVCDIDPQSNFLCAGLWVLDNTVYATNDFYPTRSPGHIIQDILIGLGSILLILWVIRQFKEMLFKAGAIL